MAEGGPVQVWLRAWLEDARATVAFPGYCSKTTLGFEIGQLADMDAQERLRLQEPLSLREREIRRCDIAASIHILSGYSAHADQSGLVNWVFPRTKDGSVFPVARRLLITHGDADSRRVLREAVLNRAAAAGIPLHVDLPRPNGHGLDVRTGEPVPREWVLGTVTESTGADVSLAEALREVRELRAENARLRTKIADLESTNPGNTNPSTPGRPS
jgi:metallo-beta-lactamase family protein